MCENWKIKEIKKKKPNFLFQIRIHNLIYLETLTTGQKPNSYLITNNLKRNTDNEFKNRLKHKGLKIKNLIIKYENRNNLKLKKEGKIQINQKSKIRF